MTDSRPQPTFVLRKLLLAAELACSPTPLLFGMIAAVCVWIGQDFVERVAGAPRPALERSLPANWQVALEEAIGEQIQPLAWPWTTVFEGFSDSRFSMSIFTMTFGETPATAAFPAWVLKGRSLWAFLVWGLTGILLSRTFAFRLNGLEAAPLPRMFRFGSSRFLSAICAPLIPLLAVLCLTLGGWIYGSIGVIPLIGPVFICLTQWLPFLISLLVALMILVTLVGWPIMIVAIAVEDCDAFGGLSRTFNYLTSRFWLTAGCAGLSLIIGGIVLFAARMGVNLAANWFMFCVRTEVNLDPTAEWTLTSITGIWLYPLLEQGLGVSLFWAFATAGYLLLRQSADALPFHVLPPIAEEKPPHVAFPVVGMAANPLPDEDESAISSPLAP